MLCELLPAGGKFKFCFSELSEILFSEFFWSEVGWVCWYEICRCKGMTALYFAGGLKFFRWVISFSPFCQQLRGDDRGWDGWMASLTRWTWAWVNSGSWWGTGRPGVLRFMGSQRVGHYWATDLIWSEDWTLSYWPPGADRKSGWVIWKIRKFLPPNTNKHHLELSFIV